MDWKHLLAYITGTVDQELLLRNEYLVTENRILRHQIPGRVRLSDGERKTLAEIGQKLGKQALKEVATIVKPDTILAWHRRLVAQKFDGSPQRKAPGRPTIDPELETLIVRMAQENRSWGYDRIVGALANLGLTVSDQTVGTVLKRHGIAPAPERKTTTTWKEFIRTHMDVLVATDFFTAEVWTLVVLGRSIHTDSGVVSYEPKMAIFLRKDALYDHCCCAVALHLPQSTADRTTTGLLGADCPPSDQSPASGAAGQDSFGPRDGRHPVPRHAPAAPQSRDGTSVVQAVVRPRL
jgi:transposase